MDSLIKNKSMEVEDEEAGKTGTPRRGRSRASSFASSVDEGTPTIKRKRLTDIGQVGGGPLPARNVLEEVRFERESLEAFLFNDANKVTKAVLRFVLSKWSILETRMQQKIVEKERLWAVEEENRLKPTYAQAVASTSMQGRGPVAKSPFLKPEKQKGEVLLINMNKNLIEVLKDKRKDLKVKGIRQLRTKGVLIEVKNKEDVKIIRESGLESVGLSVSEPRKLDTCIIIYDVEKDMKVEELKDDLIAKNFEDLSDS